MFGSSVDGAVVVVVVELGSSVDGGVVVVGLGSSVDGGVWLR